MMVFITICAVPLILIYGNYDALAGTKTYFLSRFTLGNMGGATMACGQVPNNINGAELNLSCMAGSINTYAL